MKIYHEGPPRWDGSIEGTARLQQYLNFYIRYPRGDRNFSILKLLWMDMQMRIDNGRVKSYPNEFGIFQVIVKAFNLVVKIILGMK
jgi:hypothetical protein